jgi:hypothetical protein
VIEIHGERGKIGEVSLRGARIAGSTPAVQDVADHMLRKHGSPQKAFRAMRTLNNGYIWAQDPAAGRPSPAWEHAGITEQALNLAAGVTVDPDAMESPGLPVPDDPAAISIFTAHRIDEVLHKLAHASQRMEAARSASGDLRKYHAARLAGHLKAALDAGHDLAANVRAHYPEEAAELDAVAETVGLAATIADQMLRWTEHAVMATAQDGAVGLAKAVSDDARAATTAHLLETTLHELTHADRHAQQMTAAAPDDEWTFNGEHCEKHLAGATEHAGKLRQHLADNYPAEAKWLTGLGEAAADAEEDSGKQHARYSKGTVSAQLTNADTITGQML